MTPEIDISNIIYQQLNHLPYFPSYIQKNLIVFLIQQTKLIDNM
jgi:hypothetical protein